MKKGGRPSKCPPSDELIALYTTHTHKEIAAMYGVPESTVSSWFYRIRHGLRVGDGHA